MNNNYVNNTIIIMIIIITKDVTEIMLTMDGGRCDTGFSVSLQCSTQHPYQYHTKSLKYAQISSAFISKIPRQIQNFDIIILRTYE